VEKMEKGSEGMFLQDGEGLSFAFQALLGIT
jgi:hypothetical protein